jgi:antitoxin YefM
VQKLGLEVTNPAIYRQNGSSRTPSPPLASGDRRWTIILVMPETLPLSLVKARLSELVDRVEGEDERIVVTRNGRAVAVLISADDLESLEETLVVLSDRELMRRVREGERAAERGDVVPLDELKGRHSRGK